jgi:hypothetical protein
LAPALAEESPALKFGATPASDELLFVAEAGAVGGGPGEAVSCAGAGAEPVDPPGPPEPPTRTAMPTPAAAATTAIVAAMRRSRRARLRGRAGCSAAIVPPAAAVCGARPRAGPGPGPGARTGRGAAIEKDPGSAASPTARDLGRRARERRCIASLIRPIRRARERRWIASLAGQISFSSTRQAILRSGKVARSNMRGILAPAA